MTDRNQTEAACSRNVGCHMTAADVADAKWEDADRARRQFMALNPGFDFAVFDEAEATGEVDDGVRMVRATEAPDDGLVF